MNKIYASIALAMGLAFLSSTGVVAAEKKDAGDKGSVAKLDKRDDKKEDARDDKEDKRDDKKESKDKDDRDDKKGYGKGGRRDDDLCEDNPRACKPKPISR